MAETHVVSALVEKRAEIAGQITRFEQQVGQFRADLTHVDATIRLFAPDLTPDAIPAKVIRRSDGWFASGEVKRRVLRHASPLGPADARARRVRAVMVEKGLDPADSPRVRDGTNQSRLEPAPAHRAWSAVPLGEKQWRGALADRRSGGLFRGLPLVTLPVSRPLPRRRPHDELRHGIHAELRESIQRRRACRRHELRHRPFQRQGGPRHARAGEGAKKPAVGGAAIVRPVRRDGSVAAGRRANLGGRVAPMPVATSVTEPISKARHAAAPTDCAHCWGRRFSEAVVHASGGKWLGRVETRRRTLSEPAIENRRAISCQR
jgi:hypothetical protein